MKELLPRGYVGEMHTSLIHELNNGPKAQYWNLSMLDQIDLMLQLTLERGETIVGLVVWDYRRRNRYFWTARSYCREFHDHIVVCVSCTVCTNYIRGF